MLDKVWFIGNERITNVVKNFPAHTRNFVRAFGVRHPWSTRACTGMLYKVSLFLSLSRFSKVYSFDLASLLIHAVISSFNIQVSYLSIITNCRLFYLYLCL